VHLEEGFDFLGFNLRRYRRGSQPAKLLIKPSQDAVRRIRHRLADEVRGTRGSNALVLISRLNPIIRGWAAYYRGVVSSELFSTLDHYVWWLTFRWARHSHPTKSKKWIVRRYFGRFNRFRNDRWVFGARDHVLNDRGDVAFLTKFSWTGIVRHQLVAGGASPDDPDLADYWATRRRKVSPPLDRYNLRLLAEQDGRCPLCGDHILTPDRPPQYPHDWERWWLGIVKRAIAADFLTHHGRGGAPDGNRTRLVHTYCHRSLLARQRRRPAPATPSGLA
jgi:RNA-directed DNA polymerase